MRLAVSLLVFFAVLQAGANELTLYFIQSPRPLDWTSPGGLARTAIFNSAALNDRAIGHAFVELNCTDSRGEITDSFLSGMTSQGDGESIEAIQNGYGLGVMLMDSSGQLESAELLQKQIRRFSGPDRRSRLLGWNHNEARLSFLKILISPDGCQRLLRYVHEFQERGLDQVYGGLNTRPLRGEGAGCSAFAVSFLEVAGLLDGRYQEEWMHVRHVPLAYIGGPLTGHRVPVSHLLLPGRARHWAHESEPHIQVNAWDPTLMAKWVLRQWHHPETPRHQKLRHGRARGLLLDRRDVPAPQSPIWQDHLD